jgi:cholesterol transport system auxiliary component
VKKIRGLLSSALPTCRGLSAASMNSAGYRGQAAVRRHIYHWLTLLSTVFLLCNCTSVGQSITHRYALSAYSCLKTYLHHQGSLFISPTEAVDGYQTDAMLYQNQPYEIRPFAHHAWQSNPSGMIYPLIYQSLQESHVFNAIVTGPYAWQTDYRLDTQLIQLVQNFQIKPSRIMLTMKASLTRVSDNHVMASKIWHKNDTFA